MKELIKKLLKKYSKKELANAAGYTSEMSIHHIANGRAVLPIRKQKALALALGLDLKLFERAYVSDIKAKYK